MIFQIINIQASESFTDGYFFDAHALEIAWIQNHRDEWTYKNFIL